MYHHRRYEPAPLRLDDVARRRYIALVARPKSLSHACGVDDDAWTYDYDILQELAQAEQQVKELQQRITDGQQSLAAKERGALPPAAWGAQCARIYVVVGERTRETGRRAERAESALEAAPTAPAKGVGFTARERAPKHTLKSSAASSPPIVHSAHLRISASLPTSRC